MADNKFRPPPREKNVLDNPKLKLYAPNSKGQSAKLGWELFKNNPRIVVRTNDPEDTVEYGKITAAMDLVTFFALMQLITQAANAKGEFREKIDNKNFTWGGGQRSEKPVVVNSTIVSRDAEGVISLTVSAPRRPVIKFQFDSSDYHNFVKSDGTPLERGEASQRVALGYVNMLEMLMAHLAVVNYVEPEQKQPGGGGGGGFQRGGQGGGGGGNFNRGGGNQGGGGGGGGRVEDSLDDVDTW